MLSLNSESYKLGLNFISLVKALLVISALKNIVFWRYPLINNGDFYHYPVFSILALVPNFVYVIICALILLLACCSLFINSKKIFIFNLLGAGSTNIFLQLSDYLALHHDMYLSGVAFISLGAFYLKKTSSTYGIVLAITSSTYFLSGLYKLNHDFLNGSITSDIIERSSRFFYGKYFIIFKDFSVELSYFALLVEIVEPLCLLFGTIFVRRFSILATLPFHISIILTGTGTLYNLIYPVLFWFLAYQFGLPDSASRKLYTVDKINSYSASLILLICILYITYLVSFLPNVAMVALERLLN